MTAPTRSPLKDKPLRTPGQGLDEQRRKLLEDKLETWLLLAAFMVILAGLEWARYFLPLPPRPWIATTFAVLFVGFAAWRFVRIRPQVRQLRQGAEGEKAVGQFLDSLRADGYQVFHDVQADGFNLDHVLIGPAGVFTIETKTWSKPVKGDARIRFDGERVLVAGQETERNVVGQALGQAGWLKRLLAESTGRPFHVHPVVVFPGWYVEAAPGSQAQVWVMEPKGFPAFLARQARSLADEDIKMSAFHLSRYIRVRQRESMPN